MVFSSPTIKKVGIKIERFVADVFLKEHQQEKVLLICEDIAVVSALDSLLERVLRKGAYAVFMRIYLFCS